MRFAAAASVKPSSSGAIYTKSTRVRDNSLKFPLISAIVSFTLTYSCFYGIILLYWGENNNNIPHWTLVQPLLLTTELRCNLNKRPAARRIAKIFIDRAKKTCYNGRRYSELHYSLIQPNKKPSPAIRRRFLGFRPKKKGGNRGSLSKIFQNGHLQYCTFIMDTWPS